jgi:hypothetical protein
VDPLIVVGRFGIALKREPANPAAAAWRRAVLVFINGLEDIDLAGDLLHTPFGFM